MIRHRKIHNISFPVDKKVVDQKVRTASRSGNEIEQEVEQGIEDVAVVETPTQIVEPRVTPRHLHNGKKIFIIRSIVFLGCCLIIGWARGGFMNFFQSIQNLGTNVGSFVEHKTRSIMSASIGTQPQLDANGNFNIALLGYGGGDHDGTYLTDAIIIASVNVNKGTMSMLSIPRDLYVKKPAGTYGKINSLYEQSYYRNKKNVDIAAKDMAAKLTEITSIPIPYYAIIDFAGFETVVDSLGGVEIDVPDTIYDSAYPGDNNSYIIFSINSGLQTLDGSTALKYARSRHSTSDYSRSMRQQAIIQAIMDKLFAAKTVLNPNKAKQLYTEFTSFVKTNVSLGETLWALPYAGSLDHKASWQVAACGARDWQRAQAGCLLYSPALEAFGGMSVQLPNGAGPSNVSNYSAIHDFVADMVMRHDFIAERPTVRVLNGIGTGSTATSLIRKPLANTVAIDLIEHGFTVYDAKNADVPQTQTTITTNGPGRKATKEKLSALFPGVIISEGPAVPDGPSIVVVIGDDYESVIAGATAK